MEKLLAVEQLSKEGVEQRPGHPLPRSDHMLNQRAGKKRPGVGGWGVSWLMGQQEKPLFHNSFFEI